MNERKPGGAKERAAEGKQGDRRTKRREKQKRKKKRKEGDDQLKKEKSLQEHLNSQNYPIDGQWQHYSKGRGRVGASHKTL